MPLKLAIGMILFCKNDETTPGMIKAFLYYAEFEKSNKSN